MAVLRQCLTEANTELLCHWLVRLEKWVIPHSLASGCATRGRALPSYASFARTSQAPLLVFFTKAAIKSRTHKRGIYATGYHLPPVETENHVPGLIARRF